MAKVSLRMYNREIEGLIEHGQRLDEAIAHCRHILKSYPKYLETYRLLGKANLEAKRYNEAVDVFQRVLVAAPDDFVSHVGMSIIADDQNKLDDAIWHMERAFEVQPSNAAIQGELQRLFGRRDGVEPPKIRLTRAALAHMYVQGELYNQAISEIRAVLSNDPKRTDMQVLLAKAYFRNGQKPEATDLCTELLKNYPYCLDANRLMVEILPGTQRADSLQEYRNRVNELDPYAAFTQESLFHTETVSDNAISLEHLEYIGQPVDASGALGIGLVSDTTAIGSTSNQPKWLNSDSTTGSFSGAATPVSGSQGSGAGGMAASGDENDIPDFLRHAGWQTSSGEFQESPSSYADDNGSSGAAVPGAVQGDLPDWVKALAPADDGATTSQSSPPPADNPLYSTDTPDWLRNLGGDQPASPPPMSEEIPKMETPDWLKSLGAQELDEKVPTAKPSMDSESPAQSADWLNSLRAEAPLTPQPGSSHDETPDWLKEFDNDLETPIAKTNQMVQPAPLEPKPTGASLEPKTPPIQVPEPSGNLGSLGTTAQEQDDAMAWLEGLASKHGAKPEELVTDPNARTDIAPDWVDKAKEIGEQAPAPGAPVIPAAEDLTGSWLRNLETSETDNLLPKQGMQETPDWKTSLKDQDDFAAGFAAESSSEKPTIMDDLGTPDWLNDLGPKPVKQSSIEDIPDWLHGTSTEPTHHESIAPQDSSSESGSTLDLPDWLAGLDKEEAAAPSSVTASDEVPSWLKSDVEPEPEITEKARPADWQPVETKEYVEEPPVREPAVMVEAPAPTEKPMQKIEQRTTEQTRPVPAKVLPSKPAIVPSKPVQTSTPSSLGSAQTELGRGNIAASLDIYSKLIRKGKSLEEIIRDLRDALYRYPVEVAIWQALGDAYMRANLLQEALDAYTKAEELLR